MPLGKRIMSQSVKADDMKDCENEKIAQDNKVSTNSDKEKEDVTMFHEEIPRYSFEDIILNNDTFESIQDVLTMYEKRDLIFNQWGLGQSQKLQNRVGINLYGASGTGKSMVAHAIANQLNRKILTVDYSQIESKYVGETSKNLVNMFDYAKKVNAVIFFDEADALLSKRVTNMSNATDVSVNQTRSTLLVLINEYDDLILYASNFITNYDPAFMRRILAHIKFELPNEGNRLKLWKKYIPDTLPTNVDVAVLAKKYDGISGSDIANAVMNASLRAARFDDSIVHHEYFENAIEQILKSKIDNAGLGEMVSKRTVSEEYVKTQLGKGI